MRGKDYQSWGRYPVARHAVRPVRWPSDPLPLADEGKSVLPYGLGRSYGDSCLNDGGILLDAAHLDRFLSFDPESGILRCEAGVTLEEILEVILPKGWFLPVTPGTKHVTIGGAVANDIHGKNHHRAGTFGAHVHRFDLVRSSGERLSCSETENPEWFRATIGGLGLTGLITRVELRLKRIGSAFLDVESIRYGNLEEFFALASESDRDFEYTVAWTDCLSRGEALGRGLFLRADHEREGRPGSLRTPVSRQIDVPFNAPSFLLGRPLVSIFNSIYYRRQREKRARKAMHYIPFFFPLDAIGNWNRLYGKRGFFQYQCVVPEGNHREATREILSAVSGSPSGAFLGVLKLFGDVPSPGILSFPRKGATLALDFPNRGRETLSLLDRLDAIVREAAGAVYPAKDARMSAESFEEYFPRMREFSRYVDERFSSSFWRRVGGNRAGGK